MRMQSERELKQSTEKSALDNSPAMNPSTRFNIFYGKNSTIFFSQYRSSWLGSDTDATVRWKVENHESSKKISGKE